MRDENPATVCNYGHLANHILLICSWDGGALRPPHTVLQSFPSWLSARALLTHVRYTHINLNLAV